MRSRQNPVVIPLNSVTYVSIQNKMLPSRKHTNFERAEINGNTRFCAQSHRYQGRHAQADAALILTEWDEFKHLDWTKIYKVMRKPAWIFDSRICLDRNSLIKIGFKLWTLGSP